MNTDNVQEVTLVGAWLIYVRMKTNNFLTYYAN